MFFFNTVHMLSCKLLLQVISLFSPFNIDWWLLLLFTFWELRLCNLFLSLQYCETVPTKTGDYVVLANQWLDMTQ